MLRLYTAIFLGLFSLSPSFVMGGSSEAGKSVLPPEEVARFSNSVQQNLASHGAHVAIVARTGRNPAKLPEGVQYTHVAFWVFSNIIDENGKTGQGYRVYNLYQNADNKTQSSLVQDSPADFFAGAWKLDAGIIIPDKRLQQKLLNMIASPAYANLHNPKYSVLANPNTRQFQNCTEHTLDILMASIYGTNDISQIKANIAAHFDPQPIKVNGLQRVFAPLASQALVTTDHGTDVKTATFGSIARFMRKHDLATHVYNITP